MSALMPVPSLACRIADASQPDMARAIDAYVMQHPQSTPFHLTAWNRATARACGQKTHYIIAEDGDGQIAGLLPMTEIRSRLFGNALASVGFATDGGALADSESVALQLVDEAVALSRAVGCPTVELRGGALPQAGWTLDETTYVGFIKELSATDEEQLLAVKRKTRVYVRRGIEHGFGLTVGSSQKDRDAHFAVYSACVRNLGTPVFPRALFNAVLDEMGDDADILTIWENDVPVASVLNLYHKGMVMPYWGGGTAEARKLHASDAMYFQLMLHARREKGCTRFDFGRSKVGAGPDSYKINFGFTPHPLSYAKCSTDGSEIRNINPNSPKYRLQVDTWKKLPLWLANTMGPMIAKGLG